MAIVFSEYEEIRKSAAGKLINIFEPNKKLMAKFPDEEP